jgi:very-short-patch-repair endonuclease
MVECPVNWMQIPLLKGEGGAPRRVRGKEMRPKFVSEELPDRASQLRRDNTGAEREAWRLLKDRRTLGLKFRRQVPIDRYIVDFYCAEIRVIVELDGGVHDQPEQVKWDEKRNKRLVELGYRVLHIANDIVLEDPESFSQMIQSLYPSPGAARHPLPSGEG